jgi:hypothetical protein
MFLTPQQIWRNTSLIKIPKLHIEWPMQAFVAMVSEMYLTRLLICCMRVHCMLHHPRKEMYMKNIQMISKMRRRRLLKSSHAIFLMDINSHNFIHLVLLRALCWINLSKS